MSSSSKRKPSPSRDISHLSAAERKKRKPISCDNCRLFKRKCDRERPCSHCKESNRACSYKQATAHLIRPLHELPVPQQNPDQIETLHVGSSSMSNASSSRSPLTSSLNGASSNYSPSSSSIPSPNFLNDFVPQTIPTCPTQLGDRRFVDVLLNFWFQELDYMYDSVHGTELHLDWRNGRLDLSESSVFRPLLAALLALSGQLRPRELDKALYRSYVSSPPSAFLARQAFEYAIRFTDEYLDTYDPKKEKFVLEYLHTSLHVMAYLKNCCRTTHVRNRILRDISCIQLAHIHLLDSLSPTNRSNQFNTPLQRQSARRLFWSYFQYDRFFIMIEDAGSFCIQADQCDIWMCDEGSKLIHIQDLCQDIDLAGVMGGHQTNPKIESHQLRSRPILATREELEMRKDFVRLICPHTRFSAAMIQAAAIGGKTTDVILHIHFTKPDSSIEPANDASEALRCFTAAGILDKELLQLQKRYEVEFGVAKSMEGPATAGAMQWQSNVLSITLSKLRRDAAVGLGMAIPLIADDPTWLNRRRIETAATLLQYALILPQDFSVSALCWSFFLFYISEPIMELMSSALDKSIVLWQSKEILKLALQGRNLLCQIARESQMILAQQIAQKVCHFAATDVLESHGVHRAISQSVRDVNNINVDVNHVSDEWLARAENHRRHYSFINSSPASVSNLQRSADRLSVRSNYSTGPLDSSSELPLRKPNGTLFRHPTTNNGRSHIENHSPYPAISEGRSSLHLLDDDQIQPFDPSKMDQSEWLESLFEFQIPSNLQPLQLITQSYVNPDQFPNTTSSNLHALLNHSEPTDMTTSVFDSTSHHPISHSRS